MQKRDMRGVQEKKERHTSHTTIPRIHHEGKIEKEVVKCVCHTNHFRGGAIFQPLAVLHRRKIPFQNGRRVAFKVSDATV